MAFYFILDYSVIACGITHRLHMKDGLLWGCWHYLLRFPKLISFTVKLAFCVRLKTYF